MTSALRIAAMLICICTFSTAYGKKLVDKLPPVSPRLEGYADLNQVRRHLSELPLHVIEGIWQFPSDGAVVAIERYTPEGILADGAVRYRMIVLRSPVRSIHPGGNVKTRHLRGTCLYLNRRRLPADPS